MQYEIELTSGPNKGRRLIAETHDMLSKSFCIVIGLRTIWLKESLGCKLIREIPDEQEIKYKCISCGKPMTDSDGKYFSKCND